MDNILVGTASWTDKTLIDCGRFYPNDCKNAQARLRYYATQFPVVEVDSSYYGIPTPVNAQLWAQRTPPGFVFNVKAFRLFTGHQTSPEVLHKDLREALGPDPPKTLYYRDTPAEIRDELWRRFIEALAIVRLHGRNAATWNIKGATSASSRFDYWYSREELAAMAPEIRRMAGLAQRVHVLFNTNYEDQGQVSARLMRQVLASTRSQRT